MANGPAGNLSICETLPLSSPPWKKKPQCSTPFANFIVKCVRYNLNTGFSFGNENDKICQLQRNITIKYPFSSSSICIVVNIKMLYCTSNQFSPGIIWREELRNNFVGYLFCCKPFEEHSVRARIFPVRSHADVTTTVYAKTTHASFFTKLVVSRVF